MALLILLFFVVFPVVDWEYFPHPFIWGFFILGGGLIYWAIKSNSSALKIVLFNIAILFVCLGFLETVVTVMLATQAAHERKEGDYNEKYFRADEVLGYAPRNNVRASVREYHDKELIYNVVYTINKDGLRVSPVCDDAACYKNTVLFFGCSYTYGEGINDNETFPYLVGTSSKTKVYNFGFHGYGPHQMLSEIEHGFVKHVVDSSPKYAIFTTAYFQVERAAGYDSWDYHGPKYILSKDGKLEYAGHFDDPLGMKLLVELSEKSSIVEEILENRNHVDEGDVERYVAIVVAAKNALLKEFPGIEFHVIYWDFDKEHDPMILERFQQEGIKVHLISKILQYPATYNHYVISAFERHPNSTANKCIATYIVENILHKPF